MSQKQTLQLPSIREIDLELAHRHLVDFVTLTWCGVEVKPYIHGTIVEAICDHLEAVINGDIRKLIITVPPRHMKSLLTSVFLPAWAWIDYPELQFLFASYTHSLSIRDSVRCRRLMLSSIYGELKSRYALNKWSLTDDQNTKIRFDNDRFGYRISTSVDGALTGEGGDIIVVDDPHNVIEGESEAVRKSTLAWWDEAMSTRLNDARSGRYVIIGQRVHEEDLIGHILDRQDDWVHLCLPARYEGESRICSTLPKWREDWRSEEGDLLWPERFGEEQLREIEEALGPYGTAAQLQQRPSPRQGGMFQPEKAKVVDKLPGHIMDEVRYWDKAGSADSGAYTAGVKMAKLSTGQYAVMDVVRGQWVASDRERIIKDTAEKDGHKVHVGTEQEPGSGGKESAENTIKNLAGFKVFAERVTGDKASRAEPYSIQFNVGNVLVMNEEWRKVFMEEHRQFPMGRYKDQVDAASGAFNHLSRARKKAGAWGVGR